MALIKEIELQSGIILTYHRIASLNKITNINNIIEISSYANEKQRQKEKVYQDIQKKSAEGKELTEEEKDILEKGINIFIDTEYINIAYNESQTIEEVYEYLKTTEKFKNAEDI